MTFEFWQCAEEDQRVFASFIGDLEREPDLVIADEKGEAYLYRWYVIPRNADCNVYAHVQVASDPARPLHDHPWDNTSVILAGGYIEHMAMYPADDRFNPLSYKRVKGDAIFRKAQYAHRLMLPNDVPYTMTMFSTGPKRQEWGFWIGGKKHPWETVTKQVGNASLWTGPRVEGIEDAARQVR